jgi:hypothetical protein
MPSDQEFLLYLFDSTLERIRRAWTAARSWGKQTGLHHIPMPRLRADRKSMSAMNDARFTPASFALFNPHFSNLLQQLFFSGE